jgi:uncharacterized protein (DUF934 family)
MSGSPETRLWSVEGFRPDPWVRADSGESLAGGASVILPLAAYRALDGTLRQSVAARLAVELQPADPIDAIGSDLDDLPLVALAFPAFNDGRSFSKAELLRTRYAYRGRIRATGQVLFDQLPHMLRLGFDEFEVSHPVLIARLEAGKIGGIELHYQQTSVPDASPAPKGAAYSWRGLRAG